MSIFALVAECIVKLGLELRCNTVEEVVASGAALVARGGMARCVGEVVSQSVGRVA